MIYFYGDGSVHLNAESDRFIGYVGENECRTLVIKCAPAPAAAYTLETDGPGGLYVWALEKYETGLRLPITSALLTAGGAYSCQVVKTLGDVVEKTNVFRLVVFDSIGAAETAEPAEQSVFQQQIQEITEICGAAEDYSVAASADAERAERAAERAEDFAETCNVRRIFFDAAENALVVEVVN